SLRPQRGHGHGPSPPGPHPHGDRHRLRGHGPAHRARAHRGAASRDRRPGRDLAPAELMPSVLPILPFVLGLVGAGGALVAGRRIVALRIWGPLPQLALVAVLAAILVRTFSGEVL